MAFGETTANRSAYSHSYDRTKKFGSVDGSRSFRPDGFLRKAEPTVRSGNSVIDSLDGEMARSIQGSFVTVELNMEQVLFQEEDDLDVIYFPVTAVVSEFRMLEDGRMVEIAVTGNEGAVGLSNILAGSHIAHNYTQVSQGGLAKKISVSKLERLLRSDEQLRFALGRHTDHYIRQISQKSICNMYHSVKERMCTWLLMVQDRSGKKKMHLTHEQISRILGVNRPSVSRMAFELRESNLISYSRGGLRICDRERVEDAACTCYFELSGPETAWLN
ncbi:MAG: Crp/Fnr family transcriptional regulator [Pyrinomonadaceae bacterium]|nr:Crp/Fnr family transcriptional regulator [Acidobacteriota bacterium]MBK7933593.1 Crp/Fnr family transcriptional regulator [Acidobacteriota bacterium]MBP7375042.1 Crp/Fnr family transcriptional regulator [Pyrinomonadaceae bacterium]